MSKDTLTKFLMEHKGRAPASFHMPGHKGSAIYRDNGYGDVLDSLVDIDVTEIPGADNLFQPEGVIKNLMERYRKLYDAERSYVLINGSSAGLVASILTAVRPGGKLILARNCHKSIFNAVAMGQLEPVYAYPEILPEYGITGQITCDEIERCMDMAPEAEAVILPSPNYYGICSDIEKIAEACHSRGKILIVDQAHGAHLKFFGEFYPGRLSSNSPAAGEERGTLAVGEERVTSAADEERVTSAAGEGSATLAADVLGADLVVESTHKTLASFTQSAVLNVYSDRVDISRLEDQLERIQSTSPSYILMTSMDINADVLERKGQELMASWERRVEEFYAAASEIPGLVVMSHPLLDHTKINLDMSAYGIDGLALEQKLIERQIFPELATGNILMCMTGIGNSDEDFDRLLAALKEIAEEAEAEAGADGGAGSPLPKTAGAGSPLPKTAGAVSPIAEAGAGIAEPLSGGSAAEPLSATDAGASSPLFNRDVVRHSIPETRELVELRQAIGRTCARAIIPYPPGIPLVCPGEEITEEIAEYVMELRRRGEKVMGVEAGGEVFVGSDTPAAK